MYFKDRTSAGIALGGILIHHRYQSPIIFALPRGGVPVAAKVANILDAPLEIIVVRKLGMPFDPEFAFGAIAQESIVVIDDKLVERFDISPNQINNIVSVEEKELERRSKIYGSWTPTSLAGNTAIIIDDGVATGRTMLAAIQYLKKYNPNEIIVATPVISSTAVNLLKGKNVSIIYLVEDDFFASVGEYYGHFSQLTDKGVLVIMRKYPSNKPSPRI